jgi:hypothetical protein
MHSMHDNMFDRSGNADRAITVPYPADAAGSLGPHARTGRISPGSASRSGVDAHSLPPSIPSPSLLSSTALCGRRAVTEPVAGRFEGNIVEGNDPVAFSRIVKCRGLCAIFGIDLRTQTLEQRRRHTIRMDETTLWGIAVKSPRSNPRSPRESSPKCACPTTCNAGQL